MSVIILINTITTEKVAQAIEAASLGTAAEQAHAETLSEPVFKADGQEYHQPQGEWKHYTQKEYDAIKDQLAKYPDLKEPHVMVEEELAELISERRLNQKAKAMQEANEDYGEEYPLPEIASVVLKIAPVKEPEKEP